MTLTIWKATCDGFLVFSLPQGEILLDLSPRRREDQAGTIPNVTLLPRRLARGLLMRKKAPRQSVLAAGHDPV